MAHHSKASAPALVHRKVVPPGLPSTAIARPRLDALYAELLDKHEALAVFAAPGSGKTIQAQMFASREEWPLAWLTLDGADQSAGRLLSYLVAALRPHVQGIQDVLEAAFDTTPVPQEIAAILAEAVTCERLLIVFDQCEAIAESDSSCSTIEALLDYLPVGVKTILLSRQEMNLSLGRLVLHGRAGRITEEDLAANAAEAELLMRARGDDGDVHACLEQTRGWIAAVAFGASGGASGVPVTGDFSSYMAAEICDRLSPEEQQFLIDTSIVDAVSLRAATRLCGAAGRELWPRLRVLHVPATSSPDGTIVYHPCFRQFLRERLEEGDPERLARLQRALADLLLEASDHEHAAELLISLGELDEAARATERSCGSLVDRCDWSTILRRLDALSEPRVTGSATLLGAKILALHGMRRFEEVRALARRLDAEGLLAEVVNTDYRVLNRVAWSMLWQPLEGLDLLRRYGADERSAGVRFLFEVTLSVEPLEPPRGLPLTETDRLLSWALMIQGRLDELVEMLPSGDEWPPRTPYATPHPVLGLVWRGELERARELVDQVPEEVKQSIHTDLWHYMEAQLLLAEGHPRPALAAAEQAIAHSRRTGFGLERVVQIVEAQALLKLGRTDDAIAVLEDSIESSRENDLIAYREWGEAVLGSALLLQGRDGEAAAILQACVDSMSRGRRHLMLPAAAIHLAEARRRLGEEEATDAAARLGYETSVEMGTTAVLQRALDEFPAVLHHHLERHPTESEWRRLRLGGSPTVARPRRTPGTEMVAVIQPFGPSPDICVNGRPVEVRRLKLMELASYLTAHPQGVRRDEIQRQLFAESDPHRGSNHFRQVVHLLRKTTGLTLRRLPGERVTWSDALIVDTVDQQFERAVAESQVLTGEDRLHRLREALDLVTGPYLPRSDVEWVTNRRYRLEVLQEEAEVEAARLALELHDYRSAQDLSEALLAHNPYSELAYRVLMETDLAVGTETSILATYRRAHAALGEIGLEPTEWMIDLLQRSNGRAVANLGTTRG